ncbi:uncharacterized protein BXZ73DRAFT_57401, partial [Epithele typhae]|uniref:uncharacterized protein n=1 Tax=Epithele typhae TaxID=378194 RepID=UPI002007880F
LFLASWGRNVPVIVKGLTNIQGSWHPDVFIQECGSEQVTPIDCATDCDVEAPCTIAEYFHAFKEGQFESPRKLKDWPPADHFQTKLPQFHESFGLAVPQGACDVALLSGVQNLAIWYPLNGNPPDLGPKMYIATGDPHNSYGTTKLHLDVTDAVNILTYAPNPSEPAALWHLFPPESLSRLRQYLLDDGHWSAAQGDPIHCQKTYISEDMCKALQSRYGVQAVRIEQHLSDAVFIPAGWAHQVLNVQNAIKIACDFVSIQNLGVTVSLMAEQRAHRIQSGGHGQDVLQLSTLMWHTWRALTTFPQSLLSSTTKIRDSDDRVGNGPQLKD